MLLSSVWHTQPKLYNTHTQPTSMPVQSNKNAYTALKKTTWKFDIGKIRNKFAFHVLHAHILCLFHNLTQSFVRFLVWYPPCWRLMTKTFIISSLLDASTVGASSCFPLFHFLFDGRASFLSSECIYTRKENENGFFALLHRKDRFFFELDSVFGEAKMPREHPNTYSTCTQNYSEMYGYVYTIKVPL